MMRNMLFRANPLLSFQAFRFSSVSLEALEQSIAQHKAADALAGVTKADIVGSKDPKWLAQVVRSLAVAEAHDSHYNGEQTAAALNEYFRKNFRKISRDQALGYLRAFGATNSLSRSLDNKFWFWETIEESIRGDVDTMSEADYDASFHAFAVNFKGSRELLDNFETRMIRENAEVFPEQKTQKQQHHH